MHVDVDLGIPDSLNINSSPEEVSGYQDALLELLELLIPANGSNHRDVNKSVTQMTPANV